MKNINYLIKKILVEADNIKESMVLTENVEITEFNKKMCMDKQKIMINLNEKLSQNIRIFSIKMVKI